jgi:CRISPR type IV-associated protein Csf3
MTPLRVTAEMASRTLAPSEGLHLDGLLMAAVCKRDGIPPLTSQADALAAPPIEIPIALSNCGRYYLTSSSIGDTLARELRYLNKRFPMAEAVVLGDSKLKRVATGSGPCKAFRIPVEAQHVPQFTWYAVGDPGQVRELLTLITRLGRRRVVGEGLVREWRVEECETWPGFPVLKDGRPLRPLPIDADGLVDYSIRFGRLSPPYWLRVGEEEVACP